jgi:hypothetical protein
VSLRIIGFGHNRLHFFLRIDQKKPEPPRFPRFPPDSAGLRLALDRNDKWNGLAAIQVPVSGPHPYAFQPNLALARNY